VPSEGTVLAPLTVDPRTFVMWYERGMLSQDYVVRSSMSASVIESFHKGQQFYDEWVETLQDVHREMGRQVPYFPAYKEMKLRHLSGSLSSQFEGQSPVGLEYVDWMENGEFVQNTINYLENGQIHLELSPQADVQPDVKEIKQTETTSYAEREETPPEVQPDVSISLLPFNPFPPSELASLLEREYLVHTFTVSSADAYGTLLHRMDMPGLLMSTSSAITDALKYYDYFRPRKVIIGFRANTTSFNFGGMLIGYLPYHFNQPSQSIIPRMTSLQQTIQGPHVLLDYQSRSDSTPNVTIEVPYCTPYEAFSPKTKPYTSAVQRGAMCAINCWVYTPLRNSSISGVNTATVTVYARFSGVELAGPSRTSDLNFF
jgi:hypothetical protein